MRAYTFQDARRHNVDLLIIGHIDHGGHIQIHQHIFGLIVLENHRLPVLLGNARYPREVLIRFGDRTIVFVSMVIVNTSYVYYTQP